jgi:hypothetical protein
VQGKPARPGNVHQDAGAAEHGPGLGFLDEVVEESQRSRGNPEGRYLDGSLLKPATAMLYAR